MHVVWYHTNICIDTAFWHLWRLVQSTAWKTPANLSSTLVFWNSMSLSSLPSSKDWYALYLFPYLLWRIGVHIASAYF